MAKNGGDATVEFLAVALVAGMAPVAIHAIYDRLNRKTSSKIASPARKNKQIISSRDRSPYHTDEVDSPRYSTPTARVREQSPHSTDEVFTSEADEFGDEQDDSADEDFYFHENESRSFSREIYDPLEGKGCTRVIKLHRGEKDEELHCTLSQMNLDEMVNYKFDAISYVWGGKFPARVLYCHNAANRRGGPWPLTITPSLYSALVRFRLPDKDRWLWADAICINQKDLNEKSQQVLRMAEIYSKAHRTLIWLGNDPRGARCLEFFKMLADISGNEIAVKEEIRLGVEGIFRDEGYRPLKLFFQDQEWFSRRWVIQEVAMSRFPMVYCGDSKVHWQDFVAGVNLLTRFPTREFDISGTDVKVLTKIQDINVLWECQDESFGILDLLTAFHSSECDRNRDRIYALMNLTDIKITPNYSRKGYEHIYLKFGRKCVQSEGLDILHCGPAFQHKNDADNLSWPSWIPDWSQDPSFMSLLDMKAFSAGGSRLRQQFHLVSRREISVRGRIFRDGCSIRIRRYRRILPTRLEKVHSWIAELIPSFRDLPPNDYRALAITLVAGRSHGMSFKSCQESFESNGSEVREEDLVTGFSDLLRYAQSTKEFAPTSARMPSPTRETRYSPSARKYAQLIQKTMEGRRFFLMDTPENTYLGIGPSKMSKDDIIAIFDGARTPFVIRNAEKDQFRLVGDCYIHGLMKGEALELGLPTRDFNLI